MTTSKLLFSSNYHRFRILLHPPLVRLRKDAWLQIRLLGTAAAHEIAIDDTRISKRTLSKLRRRAMIEEFVKTHRSMNAGKFPATSLVRKHVGGSFYTVKVILQELQLNTSSSALATATKNSTIWKTTQANEICDVGVTIVSQVSNDSIPNDSIAVVEEYGSGAEFHLSCKEVVDKNICQQMVDMSQTNNDLEKTAEYSSSSEKEANLDFVGEHGKAFAGKEIGEVSRLMESQKVHDISSMVGTASSNQIVMDDSESPAKPGHPSVVIETSNKSESVEVDGASAEAFEPYEVAREATAEKTEDNKLQKSSLWGNLKGYANNIINFWRTT